MFNFLKKSNDPKPASIRDMLFGDLPLAQWTGDSDAEPWDSFRKAAQFLKKKDQKSAILVFQQITEMQGLESRHYLQAWHFLRGLGIQPPADKAKLVYGVVVEVGMESGADLLAAYRDHHARYYNYSGAAVIWEHPDTSLDDLMDALLNAGQEVANLIGPWEEIRPPTPTADNIRLNMLTPSGLHFGYGGFDALSKDPKGAAIINPATQLMQALIAKQK